MLKDEALTEIAAHPPETPEALERVRAVPKGFANSRLGKGLNDAIAAGMTAEPPEGAVMPRTSSAAGASRRRP